MFAQFGLPGGPPLPPCLTQEMAQGMTKDKFKQVIGVSTQLALIAVCSLPISEGREERVELTRLLHRIPQRLQVLRSQGQSESNNQEAVQLMNVIKMFSKAQEWTSVQRTVTSSSSVRARTRPPTLTCH